MVSFLHSMWLVDRWLCLLCSVGDQIVSVNGMSVFAMNVEQVKGLLASIPGGEFKLTVLGRWSSSKQPDHDWNSR